MKLSKRHLKALQCYENSSKTNPTIVEIIKVSWLRYLFFVSIPLVILGCASQVYLQDTKNMPVQEVAVLKLWPSFPIGVNSLKIDGLQTFPENRHVKTIYLLPGKHEIEFDSRSLGKCLQSTTIKYYADRARRMLLRTETTCNRYEKFRSVRKGELIFEAGYEHDFSCYRYLLPVVKGEISEHEKRMEEVCRSKEKTLKRIIE